MYVYVLVHTYKLRLVCVYALIANNCLENYENLTSSITNFMCARVLSVKTKKKVNVYVNSSACT